ncbi:MAG: methyltransferase domain-containing protein [Deltaproteobacteria bacterium]|nr:methyltransferase domain-containing protein [Deltaproteobacteria bacterium]
MSTPSKPDVLHTTAGDLPVEEVELSVAERTWTIRHTGVVISREQENEFLLGESASKRPYGSVLWPAAIALAHEVASRDLVGKRILELGAGTGLPGIVAAALGARVVQTDRQKLVLHVCKQNAERNGVTTIEHRIADWTAWDDTERYDLIIGSDILYAEPLHPSLRHIFETNLAPNGTVLIADPFREPSVRLFEAMGADGWKISIDKWTVGVTPPPRAVGVYALTRAR